MNNAELFRRVFGIYAEEFWSYSEEKMLDWLTSDASDTDVGDLISRQAAIDALLHNQEVYANHFGNDPIDKYTIALIDNDAQTIAQLPSAHPERKVGKWIKKMRVTETEKYTSYDPDWYCSCCGEKYDPCIAKIVNFCNVCGADMRGERRNDDGEVH